MDDLGKGHISMTDEAAFKLGENLATTPGSVIFENDIMQLIQYNATTDKVATRPLLVIPPFINKFYILDLQPENSFVKYAADQGNTVFIISWVNPGKELKDLTWDDYLESGRDQFHHYFGRRGDALFPGMNFCGYSYNHVY